MLLNNNIFRHAEERACSRLEARSTPQSGTPFHSRQLFGHLPTRQEVTMSRPLDFGAVIVAAIMILGPMALGASGMG
jgi:hypothetical protein